MATLHWPIKWSVFWLYIVCLFLWWMGKTYAIILNFYLEYQNMSQNYKNGQTTQTSNVKTARLLWVKSKMAATAIKKNWHGGSGSHFLLLISWYWWTEPTAEVSCHQLMAFLSSYDLPSGKWAVFLNFLLSTGYLFISYPVGSVVKKYCNEINYQPMSMK